MSNPSSFAKLRDILSKWDQLKSLTFLTPEMKEYLYGIMDGITLTNKDTEEGKLIEKMTFLLEELSNESKEISHNGKINIGKIQFDCRLLRPYENYIIPFDANEEYFIQHGELNEKELIYLENHKEYQKTGLENLKTFDKKAEERKMDVEKKFEEIKNSDIFPFLRNFVRKYEISISSDEFFKLWKLLEHRNFKLETGILIQILEKIAEEVNYETFRKRILSNNPIQLSEYVVNYLEIYGDSYHRHMKLLEKILVEKDLSIEKLGTVIEDIKSKLELESFAKNLTSEEDHIVIEDCDKMTGVQFQHFVGELYKSMGFVVHIGKISGDQGGDVIIEKLSKKTIIQAKRNANKISNNAVQEVVAAIKHYSADDGMVITNNYYQNSATELAKSNKIELIDRDKLKILLQKYPISRQGITNGKLGDIRSASNLPLLKDELFLQTMKMLEDTDGKPIPERMLLKQLIKTGKFKETSATSMISQMIWEKKIYESSEGHYNLVTPEILRKLNEQEERQHSEALKMQLFMDVMKSLEGDEKKPVEEMTFVRGLVKTGKFTDEEARKYLKKLHKEYVIYESKPNHYNRV